MVGVKSLAACHRRLPPIPTFPSGWASEAEVSAHIDRLHFLSPPTGKK
jgi:hypothetical protein